MAVPDAALLSDSEGSMNQDVARQHLAEQIYRLKLWDKGEVSAATKSLLLSIERPPYSIQADTVCCYSVSRCHSQSSSHDDYASSDGGDSQTSSSGQQLHYPSYAHMDPGRVRLVLPASLAQLEDIIRSCQVAFGTDYKQVLLEAFSANSHALSRFFYEPDIPWILRGRTRTFMDPCERTEALTSMLKINTQVLCLMQQQLCEQSRSFEELKVGYFAQFAKCPIKEVLEIAVCLSEAVWPATHIRPMLLACEALKDVFPLLEKLPSSESGDCLSNISHNMREAFRRLIDHTKHHIESNMKKHQDDIAIHPMTCFLICSVRSFCSHRNLVQSTLAPGDNPNNSFGHLLHDMITCWKSGLSEHANIYRADVQRQCIFVLNNRYHFNMKTDGLLDELLSDGQIVEQHDAEFKILYDGLIEKYTEEACAPAKSCLNRSCWWGSQRPSLVAFTSKFNETFDRQRTWKVADVALRQALKDSIENCILPDYTRCLENCSSSGLFCSCLWIDSARDIYSTESLQKTVQSLFEGC